MENKGLCISCINDKGCSFPRSSPVLQCEEFSGYCPDVVTMKKRTVRDKERNKKEQSEETQVE